MVGCWSEDDHGEPTGEFWKGTDPTCSEEVDDLFHDDFGFVDAVFNWSASHGCGRAGIDTELVIEDGSIDSGGCEGVPIALNDRG